MALPRKRRSLFSPSLASGLAFDVCCSKEYVGLDAVELSSGLASFAPASLECFCHRVKKPDMKEQVEKGLAISVTSDVDT